MTVPSGDSRTDYARMLEAHDDPVYWEWPPGFEYEAAEKRFLAFAREFEQEFGECCTVESGEEDASFLGQIFLPRYHFNRPEMIAETTVLRVSNWGNMATVAAESAVKPELLAAIKTLLDEFGYVYIPEDVLLQPYTGRNPGVTGIRSWWIRYFDWV